MSGMMGMRPEQVAARRAVSKSARICVVSEMRDE